jgi:DNA-directed RNA polymerase specialized sigma24 family protein
MIAHLEERKNATLEMLGELPLVQREAFLLFVEGMTLEEIAEATGVNEETAKSRIRYARNKLKQLFRSVFSSIFFSRSSSSRVFLSRASSFSLY